MGRVLRLGAVNLRPQDIIITKSVVKLRPACWTWSAGAQGADLWLMDVDRDGCREQAAGLEGTRLVALAGQAAAAEAFVHSLVKPLKAVQLLRLLDVVATTLVPAAAPQREAGAANSPRREGGGSGTAAPPTADAPAPAQEAHPWRGRRIRLTRGPNLARFPVSAEMLPWLEALRRQPLSYDDLRAALPLDAAMIDAVLDDAAKAGHLRDAAGQPLAPLPRTRAAGFWTRFTK